MRFQHLRKVLAEPDLSPRKVVRWENGRKTEKSGIKPTPFDQHRAQELVQHKTLDGQIRHENMTDGEIAYVNSVWDSIPEGTSSWMTAFNRILKGQI